MLLREELGTGVTCSPFPEKEIKIRAKQTPETLSFYQDFTYEMFWNCPLPYPLPF